MGKPLRKFADLVSLSEKHQLQQEYIACGLPILPSKRPDAANVPPVSRQDVIRTSMRILTGSAGQDVVRDYTLLLMATPTEQVWLPDFAFVDAVTNYSESAPLLLGALAESWRRLVFPMQGQPWTLFQIVDLTSEEAARFLDDMLAERKVCSHCAHKAFSCQVLAAYVQWGRDEAAAQRVQRVLVDVTLTACASSQNVEKFHAGAQVGHHQHHTSGRKPATIQRATYIMVARTAHQRLKDRVDRAVFGPNLHRARCLLKNRVVTRTSTASASLRNDGANRKRAKKSVLKRAGSGTVVATSTWQAFLALHNKSRPQGIAGSLRQQYAQMMRCHNGRQTLQVKACAMDECKRNMVAAGLAQPPPTLQPSDDSAAAMLSSQQLRRLGQKQLDVSLQQLKNHPAWQAGLQIQDMNSALAPQWVQCSMSQNDAAEICRQRFDAMAELVPNPPRFPQRQKTCHEFCGGLCCKADATNQANILVQQLHHVLQRKQLDRPGTVIVFSSVPDGFEGPVAEGAKQASNSKLFYLGSLFKKSPVRHYLVGFEEFDAGQPWTAWTLHTVAECAQVATSHQVFANLLQVATEDSDVDDEQLLIQIWDEGSYDFCSCHDFGNHIRIARHPCWRHLLGSRFQETADKRVPRSKGSIDVAGQHQNILNIGS